jgi:hypothetical protein
MTEGEFWDIFIKFPLTTNIMAYDIQSTSTQPRDTYSAERIQKTVDADETEFVGWVEGISRKDLDALIWELEHRLDIVPKQNSPE